MKIRQIIFIVIALLPLAYLGIIWNTIPDTVPTHFDANGTANGWSSRLGFLGLIGFMCAITIGTYLLVVNIHKIDPKRVDASKAAVFGKIASGVVIFLTAVNIVVIQGSLHPEGKLMDKALLPLLGLMFVFLGNYMYSVKPNYFVGIRVAWTLNNDENWRLTHRLAGRIWVAGGLLITIIALLTSLKTGLIVMQVVIAVMVLIPVGYSYSLFRKEIKNKQ